MDTFIWNQKFLTEIPDVDAQHKCLVALMNRFGRTLAAGDASDTAELDATYRELVDYAAEHFRTEGELMLKAKCDRRHIEEHLRAHGDFVRQISAMREAADEHLAASGPT